MGTVPTHERGRAREVLAGLRGPRYTVFRRDRGFKLDHARIDALATFLDDDCGYGKFRIEATLSHFEGFE